MKRMISFIVLIGIIIIGLIYVFKDDEISVKRHSIKLNTDYLDMDVNYPIFEGFKDADKLNNQIKEKFQMYIEEAESTAYYIEEENEKNPITEEEIFSPTVSLETDYTYIEKENIISLQLSSYYYSGGAHPIGWVDAFTVDTKTGNILEFRDLFKDGKESVEYISDKIIGEIDKNKELYFDGYENTIEDLDGNFQFYIEDTSVVIYFDLYELAPYAYGMPEFRFKFNEIKDILKVELIK